MLCQVTKHKYLKQEAFKKSGLTGLFFWRLTNFGPALIEKTCQEFLHDFCFGHGTHVMYFWPATSRHERVTDTGVQCLHRVATGQGGRTDMPASAGHCTTIRQYPCTGRTFRLVVSICNMPAYNIDMQCSHLEFRQQANRFHKGAHCGRNQYVRAVHQYCEETLPSCH